MTFSVEDMRRKYLPSVAPEDFFLLLAHATGKTREYLIAHPEYRLSVALSEKTMPLMERRIKHEPIALITGHKEFYGSDFSVTEVTLIPRPETEMMIDLALCKIQNVSPKSKAIMIIDVGTGSGNIILSLAKILSSSEYTKKFHLFGLDTSGEALKLARKNRRRIAPNIRPRFIQSDLIALLPQRSARHSDHIVILANLPYLSSEIYRSCPPDVKNFEPKSALMSPQQGLSHILRLLRETAALHLRYPQIPVDIFLEISPEQKISLTKNIRAILPETAHSFHQDLAGKIRFLEIPLRSDNRC